MTGSAFRPPREGTGDYRRPALDRLSGDGARSGDRPRVYVPLANGQQIRPYRWRVNGWKRRAARLLDLDAIAAADEEARR